jgi:hypothetical protein
VLLLRFNIARAGARIASECEETSRVLSVLFAENSRYFAGTAMNQISNPNRINAPRTENRVCMG